MEKLKAELAKRLADAEREYFNCSRQAYMLCKTLQDRVAEIRPYSLGEMRFAPQLFWQAFQTKDILETSQLIAEAEKCAHAAYLKFAHVCNILVDAGMSINTESFHTEQRERIIRMLKERNVKIYTRKKK